MLRSNRIALSSVSVCLIAGVSLLAGCQSGEQSQLRSITSNLTPELKATSERSEDVDVNIALNENISQRGLWNDLGRFWMLDRPTALSPFPIQSMGGQP